MRATLRPLTPGWVAGSIRARAMLSRRIGRPEAFAIAERRSLEAALSGLVPTPYGRTVREHSDLEAAQHAIAATTLWHVRVLAGWVPPRALEPIRALAAWFEIANVDGRLAYLAGGGTQPPFALGGLVTAWPQLEGAQSGAELRARLAASAWGDPGGDGPAAIRTGMRFAWARRVLRSVPEGTQWAAGGVALLLARELLLAGRPAGELERQRPPGVGAGWTGAQGVGDLHDALPAAAAWVLEGVDEPQELWRAEAAWWRRVEQDAERLAYGGQLGRAIIIAAIALLAVDGWRTAGALEVAARGGGRAPMEVFEEIA